MDDQVHDFGSFNIHGLHIAVIVGFDGTGRPLIGAVGAEAKCARAIVPINAAMLGREVAVAPIAGTQEVLILGVIQQPRTETEGGDGKQVIKAERQLVLRCGKSSLTLSADGRVTVRGKQILSRADGQNRVQGASVLLN